MHAKTLEMTMLELQQFPLAGCESQCETVYVCRVDFSASNDEKASTMNALWNDVYITGFHLEY